MKIFLLVAVLIVLFAVLLLFCPLRIDIEYRNKGVKITFRCVFLKYTVDNSKFKVKNKKPSTEPEVKATEEKKKTDKLFEGFDDTKELLQIIIDLVKNKARFSDLYIRFRYGVGDAAYTGILYGGIWALIGNVYAYLCRYFYIDFPKVELEPVFDKKVFEAEAQGIITTRLVHIITAVLRSLKVYKKHNKSKGAV